VGVRYLVHVMRPARTHGSAHRGDLVAGSWQAAPRQPARRAQVAAPARARGGRCRSYWLAYSASTDRSCRQPKLSIRSSSSRPTVPAHRAAEASARGAAPA
jgi:hypothetical protein